MQMREKVGKSRNTVSFVWGSGGSKSRLAKAVGAEPAGQMRHEKVHAVVARSTFQSQMYKTLRPLLEVSMSKKCTPLWREAHFEVKMKNTRGSDHFWKLRCRKSARCCGGKHISKSKCTKQTMFGPLLEVQMSLRLAGARDCAPCQKWAKREGFVAFSTTTTTTPHYTPVHYTTLQLQLHLHYIPLHYTPLHYTTLNYTQSHYTTLHYTPLHNTTLH